MVGVRLILLKASVAMGELSVRIVVPMAMKKLPETVSAWMIPFGAAHTQMSRLIPSYTVPMFAAFHLARDRSGQCW
jgi:hypothetical protein